MGQIRVARASDTGQSDPWACPLAALCLWTSAQSGEGGSDEGPVPVRRQTPKPRVRDAIVGQVLRRQGRRPFLSHRISESAVDGSCRLSSFHFVQLLGVADYCNVFKKKMALCQGCYEAGKTYDSGSREGRVKIQDGKETFYQEPSWVNSEHSRILQPSSSNFQELGY